MDETPKRYSPRVPAAVAMAVFYRDGGRCVVCGRQAMGDRNRGWGIAKRLPSTPRGTPETDPRVCEPSNLFLVCGYQAGCHRAVQRHPAAARRRGLRVWRSDVLTDIPIMAWTGTETGSVTFTSHVTAYHLDDACNRASLGHLARPMRRRD